MLDMLLGKPLGLLAVVDEEALFPKVRGFAWLSRALHITHSLTQPPS